MDTSDRSTTPPDEPHRPTPPAAPSGQPGFRWSWPARLALMFAGVVLPVICFAISLPEGPEYQSGNLQDYAQLLLAHRPPMPLYPFLLYSMTCMTLLVFAPGRFVKSFLVRFGIYTGVLLAVQYWLVFAVALAGADLEGLFAVGFYSLLAALILWAIGYSVVSAVRNFGATVVCTTAVVLILLAIVSLVAGGTGGPGAILVVFLPLVLCLFCATPWAVACYTIMAIYAARHSGVQRFRFSLAQLLGALTWMAAYLGAWRTSVLWALEEYANLPTTAPENCYVCTAAAGGHRRLVGAEDCTDRHGRPYRVNDQMRHLKAAELLLAGASPTVHRACRRVYDLIGPALAAALVHPLLADAAYLSLKPAEWLSRAGLALLLPGRGRLIRRIYGPGADSPRT